VKTLLEAWYAEHARRAFEKSVAACAGKLNGQLAGRAAFAFAAHAEAVGQLD